MFRPESDWTGQVMDGVQNFYIEAMASVRDARVDVRHFDWVQPSSAFSARQNIIWITHSTASLGAVSSAWADRMPRCVGRHSYMPPHRQYFGEPALQERHLVCVALGDEFLAELFDGERPLNRGRSLAPTFRIFRCVGSLRASLRNYVPRICQPDAH